MNEEQLNVCPFCGDKPFVNTYDRLIIIGCKKCDYERAFKGILTTVPHKVKVNDREYYNPKAYEESIDEWNRRVNT